MNLKDEIKKLCQEKNAIILAHYYTRDEVQEIADFIGDSLALAQKAANTDADILLMCGVNFMAETCKILCPQKKVLIPNLSAGCSLADSCNAEELKVFKSQHPDYKVVSYVNTTAEVKAESYICVTSGNADKIIESFPKDEKLIFCPDRNLGSYLNQKTGRNMLLWDGGCHVHSRFSATALARLKEAYPDAIVMAHPECKADILSQAHVIGSTAAIINWLKGGGEQQGSVTAKQPTANKTFIIATEVGIFYELKRRYPNYQFIAVPSEASECSLMNEGAKPMAENKVCCNECEYMKLATLENIYAALVSEQPEIIVDANLSQQALKPIQRMLNI